MSIHMTHYEGIGNVLWSVFITVRATAFGSSLSGEHAMRKTQRTSKSTAVPAAELDAMHDVGVDLSSHMDLGKSVRPGRAVRV
jgi:hypothetical protein